MSKTRTLRKGEIIFRDGDLFGVMYRLMWGSVGIFSDYGTDQQFQMATLFPEETFAEMDLIESIPHTATAVALEDGTVIRTITMEDYQEYCRSKPAEMIRIMQGMSARLRKMSEQYMECCTKIADLTSALKKAESQIPVETAVEEAVASEYKKSKSKISYFWQFFK